MRAQTSMRTTSNNARISVTNTRYGGLACWAARNTAALFLAKHRPNGKLRRIIDPAEWPLRRRGWWSRVSGQNGLTGRPQQTSSPAAAAAAPETKGNKSNYTQQGKNHTASETAADQEWWEQIANREATVQVVDAVRANAILAAARGWQGHTKPQRKTHNQTPSINPGFEQRKGRKWGAIGAPQGS